MGFKLGKNKVRKTLDYKYFPKNLVELRKIIYEKYIKFFNLGGIATKTIELNLNDIDVSKIEDFGWLFGDEAGDVEILDISEPPLIKEKNKVDVYNFDTSSVTIMTGMFDNCHKLKEIIGLEDLNVSNVKDMKRMFSYCEKLQQIDISKWNINNITNVDRMFMFCKNLKEIIGINKFENMKYTKGMFFDCDKLYKPDWYEE